MADCTPQQQESFRNLLVVLLTALALVFIVALVEFRSFYEPVAIIFGAALSVFGIILALLITGMTVNIVTFLGAIIGVGIVHKNGLLMLDSVKELREREWSWKKRSSRRASAAAAGADDLVGGGAGDASAGAGFGRVNMLKPLAIAVIGAVCVSVLLSLIATPLAYDILLQPRRR